MKVFLLRQTQWGSATYKTYSEDNAGRWKDLISVDNPYEADYLIVYNTPTVMLRFPAEKTFFFKGEPEEFNFSKHMWDKVIGDAHFYRRPINHWHSMKTYQEFKKMRFFPKKTKDLSWVITNYGDGTQGPELQILEGQHLRMEFLKRFLDEHPNKMYLYGRGLNNFYKKQDIRFCGGELTDKWDGVRDFRYTISFESSWQEGYFTGKIIDGILAGCMPIYWGCPDLERYLPKNSFIRVDLRKDMGGVCDEVLEIVKSDFREHNIDELKEAKRRLLDEYNIFEVFYQEISKKI